MGSHQKKRKKGATEQVLTHSHIMSFFPALAFRGVVKCAPFVQVGEQVHASLPFLLPHAVQATAENALLLKSFEHWHESGCIGRWWFGALPPTAEIAG